MEIVEKKVGELKAYENNPRKNDNAVEAVANSIREFGFKVPIVIDSNDVIVCGHTRLKAAIQLGMETVPCIVASDLSEEQIRAFRLADNKTNELAEWDFSVLQSSNVQHESRCRLHAEWQGYWIIKSSTHCGNVRKAPTTTGATRERHS